MDKILLKHATKSIADTSTKVIDKDEVLVVTPDSGSGKGKYQIRFGDGVTGAKDLPIAIDGENADDMKVSAFTTPSDENPVLTAGDTIKLFAGKIKKKFTYFENLLGNIKTITNLFGSTDAKTVARALQILVDTKFNKSDLYDGTDSTSVSLGATANSVRQVKEKTDANTTSITKLNSDFHGFETGLGIVNVSGSFNTAGFENNGFEVKRVGHTLFVNLNAVPKQAGNNLLVAALSGVTPVSQLNYYQYEYDSSHQATFRVLPTSTGAEIYMDTKATGFYAILSCCVLIA